MPLEREGPARYFGGVRSQWQCDADVEDLIGVEGLMAAVANDVAYGLASSIFTNDLKRALTYMERAEVGIAHVNLMTAMREPQGAYQGGYDNLKLMNFTLTTNSSSQTGIELTNNYQVTMSGVFIDGATMGSHWLVKFGKPVDAATAQRHKASIQSILNRIDGEMSTWKPASDISRFNAHRSTDWVAVPAELATLVATSQQITAETDGAFDITVAPLVNLWGFGPQRELPAAAATNGSPANRVPTDASIAAAKLHVGQNVVDAIGDGPRIVGVHEHRSIGCNLREG